MVNSLKRLITSIVIIGLAIAGVFVYRLPHNIGLRIWPSITQILVKEEPLLGLSIYTARGEEVDGDRIVIFAEDSLNDEIQYIPLYPAYTVLGNGEVTYTDESDKTVAVETINSKRFGDEVEVIFQFSQTNTHAILMAIDIYDVAEDQIKQIDDNTFEIQYETCTTTVSSDMPITDFSNKVVWFTLDGSKITFVVKSEC